MGELARVLHCGGRMRNLIVPMALVALCGCGGAPLSDLHGVTMSLGLPTAPGGDTFLELSGPSSNCPFPITANARATLDGQPMELAGAGGSGINFDGARICSTALFALENGAPIGDEVEAVIDDGGEQFRMRALKPLAERSWVMEPVDTGVLPMGQQVTLRWTPATDELYRVTVAFDPAGDTEETLYLGDSEVQVEGTRVTFTVPTPRTGVRAGRLSITAEFQPGMAECSGPATCLMRDWRSASRDVTLQ